MAIKNEILSALEKNRGNYVSGQELASKLGVSRTAVWKAIGALKACGHRVRAVKNRGYMLESSSDVLSGEGIAAHLSERFPDCRVKILEKVDSTNTYAKKAALEGAAHGTLVAAQEQTAGRGRNGKSFFSPPGSGLYMSLVLRPEKTLSRPQLVTVAAAVAVCRAIEAQTNLTPEIKWVNDILLGGRKICGILTEAMTDFESGGMDCVVIGIGVNCTAPKGGFPKELRDTAGAINFDGLSRNRLCADIAADVMDFFDDLENPVLQEAYTSRCKMTGRRVSFLYKGSPARGTVLGLDESCGLKVAVEAVGEIVLYSGEVRFEGSF